MEKKKKKKDTECEFVCPDGSCEKEFSECKSINGCPINKPILCRSDSSEKNSSLECASSLSKEDPKKGCKPSVQCAIYNPIKCSDGECVSSYKLCKAGGASEKANKSICPSTYPIMCQETGECVADQLWCLSNNRVMCPVGLPHKCSTGICVAFRA